MELSIFNFVVVHNWKIPRGLTKTHEADISEWAIKGLTGYVKQISPHVCKTFVKISAVTQK